MLDLLTGSWPWYIGGPLIGLTVPALLLIGGKKFGVSSNLRHMCAAVLPGRAYYFRYDWKADGLWNLTFIVGVLLGGVISGTWLASGDPIPISSATTADLALLGVSDVRGLAPDDIFSWEHLATVRGFVMIVLGGFLVGFGARYAGGCTSGHAITGLSDFQLPSLIAVLGFFAGGLFVTFVLLPNLLS
ncbi:MAG: YeeE/YedE family protein [Rhodothermales bacterium]|nr:YeeE/YedE family protein [Rhodothermales bacterium]